METIEERLANTVQEVEDGNFSALEALGLMKDLEKFLKDCMKQIEPIADTEYDNLDDDGRKNFKGFSIERRNGGWAWDFTGLAKWNKHETDKKEYEKKCKALFEHANCIDTDTGEVLDIKRKPRKDSFVFKKVK